jgi:hypothetical protein
MNQLQLVLQQRALNLNGRPQLHQLQQAAKHSRGSDAARGVGTADIGRHLSDHSTRPHDLDVAVSHAPFAPQQQHGKQYMVRGPQGWLINGAPMAVPPVGAPFSGPPMRGPYHGLQRSSTHLHDGVPATAHEVVQAIAEYMARPNSAKPPPGCGPDAIKLFVGNIPKHCTEAVLHKVFQCYGLLVEIAVVHTCPCLVL